MQVQISDGLFLTRDRRGQTIAENVDGGSLRTLDDVGIEAERHARFRGPRRLAVVRTSTPLDIRKDAAVCLRSWSLVVEIPAFFASRAKAFVAAFGVKRVRRITDAKENSVCTKLRI